MRVVAGLSGRLVILENVSGAAKRASSTPASAVYQAGYRPKVVDRSE